MTLPIRAFLIVRRGPDDWGVHVCRDLDAVRAGWVEREDEAYAAVLHIGFDRPHSGDFEELLSRHSGRMLLTASAVHGLPSSFSASARPVGFVADLPVHLALTGWGYTHVDDEEEASEASPQVELNAREWVADFLRRRPQDTPHFISSNVADERSYQENEYRLPPEVRYRSGLFRFNYLISGSEDDPCEIARAAPPWLKERAVESLDLTVRLGNVFDREQIATVADLAERSLASLLRAQNFGRKSARDLRRILMQALDAGPEEHSEIEQHPPEQQGGNDVQRSTLLAQIHRTILSCEPRAGDVLSRRMGLNRPSETLQEIANDYGVTRERIRQIEAKTIRKIIKAERWDDLLTTKVQLLLTDRQYPLPVLGLEVVDNWFAGVSSEIEALRYTLAN